MHTEVVLIATTRDTNACFSSHTQRHTLTFVAVTRVVNIGTDLCGGTALGLAHGARGRTFTRQGTVLCHKLLLELGRKGMEGWGERETFKWGRERDMYEERDRVIHTTLCNVLQQLY